MKILVAEDDPVALEALTALLAKWGHEVAVAHDGEEAERLLLAADAPAVAILDWIMPRQSGLDVCRTLRARGNGAPYVILITANHDRENMLAAFAAGVDDFLTKPVNTPELRARLHAAERIVTLQTQLQKRAQAAEERYQVLYNAMNEGMALHELLYDAAGRAVDYRILDVNPAFGVATGIAREAVVGRRASDVYGVEPPPYLAIYARVAESGKPELFETYLPPMGRHLRGSVFRPRTGQVATMFADITEQKKAEILQQRTNQALRTLSLCNTTLIHATDERRLLDDICRIVVEQAGYRLAWVGFAEYDEARSVRPVAQAGYEDGYLTTLNLTWADSERGRSPMGTAIRTGCPVAARQILTDPDFAPWREDALKRGYASVAAFTMVAGGGILGALAVYAAEPDAFDAQELAILNEMASDLAFGIETLRARAEQQRAEAALGASEARYRALFEEAQDGIALAEAATGKLVDCNGALSRMVERTKAELVGQHQSILHAPQQLTDGKSPSFRKHQEDAPGLTLEDLLISKTGKLTPVEIRATRLQMNGQDHILGIFRDITERRKAETALRESEERYRRMVELSPDLIGIHCDGKWVFMNETGARLLGGASPAEFIGKPILDIVHPDYRDTVKRRVHKLTIAGERTPMLEQKLIRVDGTVIDVEGAGVSVTIAGKPAVEIFIRDITERKRTELALTESERKYRHLMENLIEGVWCIDVDARTTFVNAPMAAMLGYVPEEMIGRHLFDFMDAQGRAVAEHNLDRRRQGIAEAHDFEFLKKDNSRVYVLMGTSPLHDEHGDYIGAIAGVMDITARREAELAVQAARDNLEVQVQERTAELQRTADVLRVSEQRYRAIISHLPGGIVHILDRDFRYVMNEGDEQMRKVGLSHATLAGKSIFDILPAELAASAADHYRRVLAGETVSFEGDFRGQSFLVRASPLVDATGQVDQILVLSVNITDQKRAERELAQARISAEAANRAKSDFLAGMSHELRTPLGSIIGFSELLQDKRLGELNPKQKKYVNDIADSGQHLLAVINDILDLSKVEAGKVEMELTPVPVATLLANSLVMVREKCLKHGITLSLAIPEPVQDLVIVADERAVKQVLYNLLSNAAKFTPDGGQIRVSARISDQSPGGGRQEAGGSDQSSVIRDRLADAPPPTNSHPPPSTLHLPSSTLIISVADTGIGIAKENQEKVFEEFYQVSGTRTAKTPGTGLGLALVRRLVGLHGGRVWVESAGEGKGSTFHFSLPLCPANHVLVHAIQKRFTVAGKPQVELGVLLFALDADALAKAGAVTVRGTTVTVDDVWAALVREVEETHCETAFSGNEFIVVTDQPGNARTALREKLRRRLKGVLFRTARAAVVDFSCGVAARTPEMTCAADLLAAARAALVRERESIQAKHIILVDDDPNIRGLARRQLNLRGFVHVSEASGGKELFGLLDNQPLDLIILDIAMPDMNGYEVIGRLKDRAATAEIPILILSGGDVKSKKLRQHAHETVIPVLAKPYDADALAEYVAYLL